MTQGFAAAARSYFAHGVEGVGESSCPPGAAAAGLVSSGGHGVNAAAGDASFFSLSLALYDLLLFFRILEVNREGLLIFEHMCFLLCCSLQVVQVWCGNSRRGRSGRVCCSLRGSRRENIGDSVHRGPSLSQICDGGMAQETYAAGRLRRCVAAGDVLASSPMSPLLMEPMMFLYLVLALPSTRSVGVYCCRFEWRSRWPT